MQAANTVGLDEAEALAVLEGGRYASDVRDDEQRAQQLGISGVPFFVIGGYVVSGAQTPETLLQVLGKAWDELPDAAANDDVDVAPACGPDGC